MKVSNKKILLILSAFAILTFVYFFSFRQWDIKEVIVDYSNKHCQINQECLVDFKDLTPFSWDRAYIFPDGKNSKSINNAIGMQYRFTDVGLKFIFIRDKEIVYSEEYFPDLDCHDKNQIIPVFATLYPKNNYPSYYFLTKENSQLFITMRNSISSNCDMFYEISPSNEDQSEKSNPYKK
ncbi:conserved protein of unknown function [Xenorhabdus poinarii G6]|uniref:Uncharacterized protein n=1 Tax=Xenorhabdus poinarii G6 TaxID=1354304 RepID=A0A068R7G3_9GAMM|nr:hypothetical protein [Xenorhabdus poinarii]CDG22949.1 conserved protein of unknown function [Xenorhabdus poinarii G6]